MRVLLAAVPAVGHLFPLVPLAWALRVEGHEVLFASLDGAEVLTHAGLPYVSVQPGLRMYDEVLGRAGAARPDLLERTRVSAGADRDAFVRLFAALNSTIANSFFELADDWKPDLIVHEYLSPIGALAAHRLGVPCAEFRIGFSPFPELRAAMLDELVSLRPDDRADDPVATVHTVPASMGGAGDLAMRPVPYDGGGDRPGWLRHQPDRGRIAVTLGTVSPTMSGIGRVRRVVAAAESLDAEIVLATGDTDLTELGPLPPTVRAPGWVSWSALLHGSSLAVHHGGSGTSLTALAAGVPQLLLPDGSDRHINAAAIGARGAGAVAADEEVSAELLGKLLTDEHLRREAGEVATEIAGLPSPATAAAELLRRI